MSSLEEAREVVAAYLKNMVDTGYASHEQLVESAACWLSDGSPGAARFAAPLVAEALDRRRAAEATWNSMTDHDRLVAALGELDARGIVSREDFGATISDAEASVRDECARVNATGAGVRGFCTFNRQDAEDGASEGRLALSCGSWPVTEPVASAQLAQEACAALASQGLTVVGSAWEVWAGRSSARVTVLVPDWRVRRFTGNPLRATLARSA